jgi:hypothetical protein
MLVLPSDLLVVRSIQIFNTNGDRSFLEKRDTSFISEYNNDGAQGLPKYYANWNENNFLVVAPTPNLTYQIQINYITYPPHFTSTNTTYLSELINKACLLAWCFNRIFFLSKRTHGYVQSL